MNGLEVIINNCVNYLQSIGLVGGFLLVLLESAFPVLPLAVFIGFNVIAFGNIAGFIISYFATVAGCILSFTLFRYVIKNLGLRIINQKTKEKIEKFMINMTNIDFNTLVVILAIPFTPAFIVNIAAGLSSIKMKKYFIALLISKTSIIFFWGYVGTNLIKGLKDPIIWLKVLGLVLITYIISKIVEKIVKVEE